MGFLHSLGEKKKGEGGWRRADLSGEAKLKRGFE